MNEFTYTRSHTHTHIQHNTNHMLTYTHHIQFTTNNMSHILISFLLENAARQLRKEDSTELKISTKISGKILILLFLFVEQDYSKDLLLTIIQTIRGELIENETKKR